VTEVREFLPEDFDAAYRLDQACYPPGIAYSRHALGEFLTLPGARAWVAEGEGALVAFVIVRKTGKARGHVITLDVREDRRRRGVGSMLLSTAENWLASEGVRRMRLETAVNSSTALVFWEKMGYQAVGVLRRYYLDRDDAYRMEKDLA